MCYVTAGWQTSDASKPRANIFPAAMASLHGMSVYREASCHIWLFLNYVSLFFCKFKQLLEAVRKSNKATAAEAGEIQTRSPFGLLEQHRFHLSFSRALLIWIHWTRERHYIHLYPRLTPHFSTGRSIKGKGTVIENWIEKYQRINNSGDMTT